MTKSILRTLGILTALTAFIYVPCKANVPTPAAAPSIPAGYCSTIATELNGDLQAFNTQLATPPSWTPVPGGPTLYAVSLSLADSNTGPAISAANYMPAVVAQIQELKALGVQAVAVSVGFPVLYEPFYGSSTALQPYLNFYTNVAKAVRAAGLKLIVDNEELFSNDISAGWTNMNAFYKPLTWPQYMTARAQMAATVAQTMEPDYLILANEPDTEATQTGQTNLSIPADAALMIQGEIAAVQALSLSPVPQLGAGFGTWLPPSGSSSLAAYTSAYVALPLNYIDLHIIPVNTVQNVSFLGNSLIVASAAAAAGMPVAIGQAWLSKSLATEWDTIGDDVIRARGPFSFWAPLDAYFLQTLQALANYTQMAYVAPGMPVYFFAYQTYAGTGSNGGADNCTCTTATCSDFQIMQTENTMASTAQSLPEFTTTAFSFYSQLVTTPDITPPAAPPTLTGTADVNGANISWGAATDDVGVAGYNVYRCTPPAAGQACTGALISSTTATSYTDTTLTSNTLYNYQIQAFDLANNLSPLSTTLYLQTFRTTADSASGLVAAPVSPTQISLSWTPPSDVTGLDKYLVYSGTSPSNLQQIVATPSTTTSFKNQPLTPGTTYYYAVIAVEQGIQSPMSAVASATTLPLPNPPVNVAATPTTTTIALSWQQNIPPGGLPINNYQVYEGTTSGKLSKAATTTASTYTATSLKANTTYYFEIVAVDSSFADSAPSDQMNVTTLPMPAAPANVVGTANSATSVTVAWSETIPANGLPIQNYTIFRGTLPTSLTQVATRSASPFTDTGLSSGTTYYYAIEATDTEHNVSPMSATAQVTPLPLPAAPVNVTVTAKSSTAVTVSWSETIPPNGLPIQSYTIFAGTSPTGLTQVATQGASPFINTGLSPNTTYYYAIEATDTQRDVSPMSSVAQGATAPLPAAPVNVGASANSSTSVTVTWSESIPANGLPIQYYSIWRGTSPTGLTQVSTRSASPFTDMSAVANTTYYYAVEAVDTAADVSPMSATAQVTTAATPAAPANVTATANAGTSITVSWSETIPPNGLAIPYYYIFRGTSPTALTKLATRSTTQFIDTTTTANTTYYYAIEAADTGGDVSPMSATAQATAN